MSEQKAELRCTKEKIQLAATVLEALPDTMFLVELEIPYPHLAGGQGLQANRVWNQFCAA